MTDDSITPRDLRVEIARLWHPKHLYELAARVHLHPVTFSAALNGRIPLDQKLARRVLAVLRADDDHRVSAAHHEAHDG